MNVQLYRVSLVLLTICVLMLSIGYSFEKHRADLYKRWLKNAPAVQQRALRQKAEAEYALEQMEARASYAENELLRIQGRKEIVDTASTR